jgi:hypothetical protein
LVDVVEGFTLVVYFLSVVEGVWVVAGTGFVIPWVDAVSVVPAKAQVTSAPVRRIIFARFFIVFVRPANCVM